MCTMLPRALTFWWPAAPAFLLFLCAFIASFQAVMAGLRYDGKMELEFVVFLLTTEMRTVITQIYSSAFSNSEVDHWYHLNNCLTISTSNLFPNHDFFLNICLRKHLLMSFIGFPNIDSVPATITLFLLNNCLRKSISYVGWTALPMFIKGWTDILTEHDLLFFLNICLNSVPLPCICGTPMHHH